LAHALYGLGNVNKAQKMLVDALWTAVELQAYIPLMFLLPVTILLLAERGQKAWAERLHTLGLRVPLLANSQFFTDLLWAQLPQLKETPAVETGPLTELRREVWAAVSQLLAEDVLA
jgi:hypothetical protein